MANIDIKINGDTKDIDSKIQSTKKKLEDFISKQKKWTKISNFSTIASGVNASLEVIGKVIDKLAELNEAYQAQAQSEALLTQAVKNSPYLNGESLQGLKKYADEMQRITGIGDERLLPLMGQLAATGRTQAEIQNIISAALDVSASGAMSLESAVINLNKTYSGLSGELGEAIPQVRALTAEQMKQGKAVEVVAQQYKGIAKETAAEIGYMQKFSTSVNTLKENLGELFSGPIKGILNFASSTIDRINDLLEITVIQSENFNNGVTPAEQALEAAKKELETETQARKAVIKTQEDTRNALLKDIEKAKKRGALESDSYIQERRRGIEELDAKADAAEKRLKAKEEEVTRLQNQVQKEREDAVAAAQQAALEARAVQAKDEYTAAIEAFEKQIALKKDIGKTTGEQITREDELRQRLDAIVDAYYKMRLAAGSAISDENAFVQKILETIRNIQEELKSLGAEFAIPEFSFSADSLSLEDQIKELDAYKASLEKLASSVDPNTEAFTNLSLAIEKVNAEMERLRASQEGWNGMTLTEKAEFINEQMETLGSGIGTALQTAGEAMENQATADLTNLENAYKKGEITEEEYYAKKEKLEKQAAKDQYKVQLAEWGLNLIMTQSSMALAIAKALSSGTPPLNIVTAAVTGAMAAAQLAAQIAAKPVPPAFATDGIVGGNSYTGDKLTARVNSGEMILNAQWIRSFLYILRDKDKTSGFSLTENNSVL